MDRPRLLWQRCAQVHCVLFKIACLKSRLAGKWAYSFRNSRPLCNGQCPCSDPRRSQGRERESVDLLRILSTGLPWRAVAWRGAAWLRQDGVRVEWADAGHAAPQPRRRDAYLPPPFRADWVPRACLSVRGPSVPAHLDHSISVALL